MIEKTNSPRGRPVGSGIDDRQRLDAIIERLAANPGMKPTTAIKALGIEDASVIRRLRDKLKASHANGNERPASEPERVQVCAANTNRPFKISEEAPPNVAPPATAPQPATERGKTDPALLAMIELIVGTWTAAFAAHQAMFEVLLQNPVVRTAIRQHIASNELALSLLKLPVSPRRTV